MANDGAPERSGALAAWLWSGAGGLICLAMSRLEPNLLEEGLVLHVGERMLAGEHLYRDVVLTVGPVPYAMVAGLFALFGSSIEAARAGVVVLHALGCGAAYLLGRGSGAGPWAHAGAACVAVGPVFFFPLLSTAFYTTVANSLVLVSAWLALRGVGSTRWAFAAGVAVAATALSKQSLGVLLAASVVPAVMLCAPTGWRLRRGIAVCAGGAVAAVTTLAVFAALGDLEIFVSSLLALPRGEVFGTPFINVWPPGVLASDLAPRAAFIVPEIFFLLRDDGTGTPAKVILLTQLLYVVPILGLIATPLAGWTRALPAGLWMFACASLACGSNLFPRADAGHLAFAAPVGLAYLVCLSAAWAGARKAPPIMSRVAPALMVAGLALSAAWTGMSLYDRAGEATWGPRVTVRPVNPLKRSGAVPRVIDYLRERLVADEAIFVARTEPLIYFATGARNPTPFTGLLQVWGTRSEQQGEIVQALEEVRFVVMSDTDGIHTVYSEELPAVQRELERNFHVPATFTGRSSDEDWIIVLERGIDRGPTLIDLLDPATTSQAWLQRPDGKRSAGPPAAKHLPARQNRRPMAVQLGPRGGGVDWELLVPDGSRFQFSVGFQDVLGWHQPGGLKFSVEVSEGGGFQTLEEGVVLFDAEHGNGRRWRDVEVDLAAFAGRPIALRLRAEVTGSPEAGQVALFGSPRIAGPPGR